MLQLQPLDQNVPIFQQLSADVSPVILFKKALGNYPASVVASPHMFTRLTVPNLCVGP